jgi:hypothetical protein
MSISITSDALSHLRQLREEKKFCEERFYPGAATEQIRIACEARVNDFLEDAISSLQRGTNRQELFTRARTLAHTFASEDTEEREKVDDYIGEVMRIIGIEDWAENI